MMPVNHQTTARRTSTELAADTSLIPVWDPSVPFPSPEEMRDLNVVTHITVERAQPGGYYYLHEATIQHHRGQFYMAWANHRTGETGDHDELIRGCTSSDAIHWSEPKILAQAPQLGSTSFNHPLLFAHGGRLYGFFACWYEEHRPFTEVFILNDSTGEWVHQPGSAIPGFVPFCTPQRMPDGNWLIGGENWWYDASVAISDGDDLTKWQMIDIPRPAALRLLYPESAIVDYGDNHLLAICRPYGGTNSLLPIADYEMPTAPTSESFDGGYTWTSLGMSNFPLSDSQPFAGRLSNGQNYLLTNSLEDGRALLSIAVTDPTGGLFRRIYKLRHQQWPKRRMFSNAIGQCTEWSYPNAFEFEGKLYIAYSQGKEDCVLSIVPIEALTV